MCISSTCASCSKEKCPYSKFQTKSSTLSLFWIFYHACAGHIPVANESSRKTSVLTNFSPRKKVNFAVSSYLSQTRQSARCPLRSLCAKASSAARSPWRTGHCCSAHSRRRWRRLRHLRRTAPRMRHFRYLRGRHCWTTFASWTTPGASSIRRTSLLTVFPVSIFGTVNFCSAMEQGQKR